MNTNIAHIPSLLSVSNKEKLTKEDAKFIFEQAEKMLKDSVDTAALIVTRMNALLPIIAAILISSGGFLIKRLAEQDSFDSVSALTAVAFMYAFVVAIYSALNLKPHAYISVGALPEDLFSSSFFDASIQSQDRILRYYVNETENYSVRIKKNNKTNAERWETYRNILWSLLLFPATMLLCYFIIFVLL